jgi:hypothetical protein
MKQLRYQNDVFPFDTVSYFVRNRDLAFVMVVKAACYGCEAVMTARAVMVVRLL